MNRAKILNTIFWVAMAYLGFWFICSLMMGLLDLKFYNSQLRESYFIISIIMIPLSLSFSFIKKISFIPLALRVFLTLCLLIGVFYLQIILVFSSNSGIRYKQELYVRNYLPLQKIVSGSNYNYENHEYETKPYKTTFIPPFFKSESPIDTTNINQGRWIKISDN